MLPLPALIAIGVAGLALLLLLIIRFKMQAFYALILVSIVVGLAAGLPMTTIPATDGSPEQLGIIQAIIAGVGGTLGSVAVLVALGSMLGKIIELSGGAESLAGRFTSWLGPKRVGIALVIAAGILAIPVFFDAGFIILVPIIFAFAKVAGLNPIKFGLPVAGIMLAVHVAVPPHPGIVGGSTILGADIGWVTIFSLLVSIPLGALAYVTAKALNRREYAMIEATKEMFDNFGTDTPSANAGLRDGEKAPSAFTVLGLILLPLALIMMGTAVAPIFEKGTFWNSFLSMVGQPIFALMVAIAAAMFFLGVRRGWSAAKLGEVMESALPAAAVIILVTGAGGAFGRILTETGIGGAVAELLAGSGMPLMLAAFLISLIMRAAQGSATVAITTTAGLMLPAVAVLGLDPIHVSLVALAIGYGGLGLSHVNDSGFWVVTRYLGLSVKDGLRTWTPLTTVLGVAGFLLTWLIYGLIPVS
ncbi:GntP family gluconate:H+ symporter [Microbacterium keratanolyticum]|uniref:Inner membrane permease YgbN n=1 Tax=Microbacterium keratanolyticum TaxID=67574 RepID=A0A9W6HVH6_9MICO|nr:GntP family transporter [Microbacterium keratanolyticum]MBM7468161.1 GntP family gluconate:H+ symporter [Microbacterium keratanolyticum]GLK03152.1 inner membrane permease YgbN [Microbacterium keratanolyticum]